MNFDVVGLGVSALDVVQLVEHFPAQEEVQRALDMTVQGGGPVATALAALAQLGARAAMVDVLGDDWRGELILDGFRRAGVCTEHIRRAEGCSSALACVLARQGDGARSIVYHPGTTPELLPDDVPRAVVQSARFLHVNGRHWRACLQAVAWAREAGVLVSFDGGAHRYRPQMRELLPLTDVCIVAYDFARRYTGETDVAQAAAGLLAQGPGLVVITDGARGSWTYTRASTSPRREPLGLSSGRRLGRTLSRTAGESFHQPAYLLPTVVDTTGCGDSFHGAFLFGLLQGMTLQETASLASAVAALNSQRLGGRGGLPSLEQAQDCISRWASRGDVSSEV